MAFPGRRSKAIVYTTIRGRGIQLPPRSEFVTPQRDEATPRIISSRIISLRSAGPSCMVTRLRCRVTRVQNRNQEFDRSFAEPEIQRETAPYLLSQRKSVGHGQIGVCRAVVRYEHSGLQFKLTLTRVSTELPAESMGHTAAPDSELAITRVPARRHAALSRMDHTARAAPPRLTIRAPAGTRRRATVPVCTEVGVRPGCNAAMIGPVLSASRTAPEIPSA
jgi:hypothetical protein